MRVALDVSPLSTGNYLQHRVRGTGFYVKNLKDSLLQFYPENDYVFFDTNTGIPNADVVHFTYFEPFFLTLPFFKKEAKKIVTVHDLTPLVFPKYFPPGLKGKIKWNIQKLSLRNSDFIITDSYSSKKDILKFIKVPEHKIKVAYLAAKENFKYEKNPFLKQEIVKKYDLPINFILYVGDATWNKNVPRIIEAVNKLGTDFVIVGKSLSDESLEKVDYKNEWNQDLKKIKELIKNNKRIYRLGFVAEEDLIKLYNAAKVLVMPSLYEGFGLPVLEAMQCGCPVITARAGSLPEIAGNAGIFVDPYNIGDIVLGINKLLANERLQKKLTEAGLKQAKKFSWKKTVDETVKIYEAEN